MTAGNASLIAEAIAHLHAVVDPLGEQEDHDAINVLARALERTESELLRTSADRLRAQGGGE